jgi:His/Glu/Gln/Arg/opine family amino acid ABC transporter permease subunit
VDHLTFTGFAVEFLPELLEGLSANLLISAAAMIIGLVVGLPIALGRTSQYLILRLLCGAYIFVFRGLMAPILLFFWYYGFPSREVTADFIALWAFILVSPAFAAEALRAGLETASGKGQATNRTLRHVLHLAIPSLTNQFLMTLQLTLFAGQLTVPDLMAHARLVTSVTYAPETAFGLALAIGFAASLIIQSVALLLEKVLRPRDVPAAAMGKSG